MIIVCVCVALYCPRPLAKIASNLHKPIELEWKAKTKKSNSMCAQPKTTANNAKLINSSVDSIIGLFKQIEAHTLTSSNTLTETPFETTLLNINSPCHAARICLLPDCGERCSRVYSWNSCSLLQYLLHCIPMGERESKPKVIKSLSDWKNFWKCDKYRDDVSVCARDFVFIAISLERRVLCLCS